MFCWICSSMCRSTASNELLINCTTVSFASRLNNDLFESALFSFGITSSGAGTSSIFSSSVEGSAGAALSSFVHSNPLKKFGSYFWTGDPIELAFVVVVSNDNFLDPQMFLPICSSIIFGLSSKNKDFESVSFC